MIINGCEIWFTRLDPERPSKKFSKKNPTWELQIRTKPKNQLIKEIRAALALKLASAHDGAVPDTAVDEAFAAYPFEAEWTEQQAKNKADVAYWRECLLVPKKIIPEDEDENPLIDDLYWRVNLKKKSIKSDGEPMPPVEIVDGNMDEVDGRTIGNGSIANVRVFQYDYENDEGEKGLASMLMAVQLTKHIVYTPKPRESFGETTTTRVAQTASEMADDTGGEDGPATGKPAPKPPGPKPPSPSRTKPAAPTAPPETEEF